MSEEKHSRHPLEDSGFLAYKKRFGEHFRTKIAKHLSQPEVTESKEGDQTYDPFKAIKVSKKLIGTLSRVLDLFEIYLPSLGDFKKYTKAPSSIGAYMQSLIEEILPDVLDNERTALNPALIAAINKNNPDNYEELLKAEGANPQLIATHFVKSIIVSYGQHMMVQVPHAVKETWFANEGAEFGVLATRTTHLGLDKSLPKPTSKEEIRKSVIALRKLYEEEDEVISKLDAVKECFEMKAVSGEVIKQKYLDSVKCALSDAEFKKLSSAQAQLFYEFFKADPVLYRYGSALIKESTRASYFFAFKALENLEGYASVIPEDYKPLIDKLLSDLDSDKTLLKSSIEEFIALEIKNPLLEKLAFALDCCGVQRLVDGKDINPAEALQAYLEAIELALKEENFKNLSYDQAQSFCKIIKEGTLLKKYGQNITPLINNSPTASFLFALNELTDLNESLPPKVTPKEKEAITQLLIKVKKFAKEGGLSPDDKLSITTYLRDTIALINSKGKVINYTEAYRKHSDNRETENEAKMNESVDSIINQPLFFIDIDQKINKIGRLSVLYEKKEMGKAFFDGLIVAEESFYKSSHSLTKVMEDYTAVIRMALTPKNLKGLTYREVEDLYKIIGEDIGLVPDTQGIDRLIDNFFNQSRDAFEGLTASAPAVNQFFNNLHSKEKLPVISQDLSPADKLIIGTAYVDITHYFSAIDELDKLYESKEDLPRKEAVKQLLISVKTNQENLSLADIQKVTTYLKDTIALIHSEKKKDVKAYAEAYKKHKSSRENAIKMNPSLDSMLNQPLFFIDIDQKKHKRERISELYRNIEKGKAFLDILGAAKSAFTKPNYSLTQVMGDYTALIEMALKPENLKRLSYHELNSLYEIIGDDINLARNAKPMSMFIDDFYMESYNGLQNLHDKPDLPPAVKKSVGILLANVAKLEKDGKLTSEDKLKICTYLNDTTALIEAQSNPAEYTKAYDKHCANIKEAVGMKRSWGRVIGGSLLCIAGILLTAAAITLTVLTFGASAPITIPTMVTGAGITVSGALITAATINTAIIAGSYAGAGVLGAGAAIGGGVLTKKAVEGPIATALKEVSKSIEKTKEIKERFVEGKGEQPEQGEDYHILHDRPD